MRAELPHKINGSAQYAIDVQVPGMLYGAVVRAPVEGAAPEKFDEAKVMMIKGIVKAVKLPYGVGVIAKDPVGSLCGRAAVEASVSWTKDGKAWGFDSEKGLVSFANDGPRSERQGDGLVQARRRSRRNAPRPPRRSRQ